ncbi:RHS repeat-associated core domain-containing protein [Flavobacterium hydatis]|uniref:RHS repeat-associated core domain-containing protein n=2 Tax=Flavobacterium hydatis TaxID=991 RepID=A0ABX4CFN2_FLAHY|nr:RHS repeat-associated core domain-containing protein [Flavobacterium hydatis]
MKQTNHKINNMKKYLSLIILLLFSNITIVAQAFSDDNFIYTATPKKGVTAEYFKTLKKDEMNQSVTYFDGLGRPVQTIVIGQGGNGEDIITPIEYDGFGRQEKEYLPFSLPNSNNKYPKIEAETAINITKTLYATEKYDYTTNPFTEKKFENSPLNRVLKQAAPGNDWAMGSGHEIKLDYQTNTTNEVRLLEAATIWNASSGLYDIAFWDNKYYDKNELYKTITYDENSSANLSEISGSTVEFTDKEGRLILKRTYELDKKHDTYYVYDEYGNLTYVIPPKADGVITDEILNSLCYQYKYDNLNRLVEKKLPGKQWEFIVYNKLNRVVATGPANSPFQDDTAVGWLITKYDAFGMPVYTGWQNTTSNSGGRYILQDTQNKATKLFETKVSSIIDGVGVSYSNTVAPTNYKLLTLNNYNKHLLTSQRERVITTISAALFETNIMYYDTYNRPFRNDVTNHLGGYNVIEKGLDFNGKTTYMSTAHKVSSSNKGISLHEVYTYSPQDRLLINNHKVNAGEIQFFADNTYDALGQLMSKNIGISKVNPFQKIDYKYNVRGWLTGINDIENLQKGGDPKDLFAFKINYNKVEGNVTVAKALYNGNIAETFWAAGSDGIGVIRGYGYQYDQLNRLKNATYQTPKLADNKNYFGENMDYDKNGNITRLQRKFMAGTSSNPYVDNMDNLGYFYADNSNQLMKVTDTSNNPQGFKDDSDGYNDTEDDYAYDDNGNLIKDQNKNITKIQYNHLNLPTKITFGTGNTIVYIYNATGQKVEKIVTENGVVTNTKYLNGFQYKNDVLQFFPTAEGYVRNTSTNPAIYTLGYVFNYTDHLGNVRLGYAQNAKKNGLEILEENNYYPFGLKHQGYNTDNLQAGYKYKYNGKELQDELDLNVYDYGARNYDPALGRWMNIDPLAEKSRRFSPYTYALNNPVYFIDPDGMMADDWKKDANGNMTYDPNLTKDSPSSQLKEGESYVGPTDTQTVSNDAGTYDLFYNADGSISSSDNYSSPSSDGIRIFGVGGDAVTGSGDLGNDRGSGAIGHPGHDFNTLFDVGELFGKFVNWLKGNDGSSRKQKTDTNVSTMNTSEPETITAQRYDYTSPDPSGVSQSIPFAGKPRDTSVIKGNESVVNLLNTKDSLRAAKESRAKNIEHKKKLGY